MRKRLGFFRTKRFEHQFSWFSLTFSGVLTLVMGVVCLFFGVLLGMSFVGQWHNIDLTVNAANIGCGFCLGEIGDHGFNMRGEHTNVTLEDGYVESSFKLRQFYWYNSVLMFLGGVSLAFSLVLLIGSGVFYEKVNAIIKRERRR